MDITYRAPIVERLVSFFEKPEDVDLSDVSQAAITSAGSLAEQSKTGMAYAIGECSPSSSRTADYYQKTTRLLTWM